MFLLSAYLISICLTSEITLPDPLVTVSDATFDRHNLLVLDSEAYAIGIYDMKTGQWRHRQGRGQGPGEFSMPRCASMGYGKVFVGDLTKMHVFDESLSPRYSFSLPNNPRDILVGPTFVLVAVTHFPLSEIGMIMYSHEGKKLRELYKHGLKVSLAAPYIAKGAGDLIWVLPEVGYDFAQLELKTAATKVIKRMRSPQYKEFIPSKPFIEKYGGNRSSYLRWRTQWSKACGIEVLDSIVFVCYEDLASDMLTKSWHIAAFDTSRNEPLIHWQETAGPLIGAHDGRVFFAEDRMDQDHVKIHGYSIDELKKVYP